MLKFVAAKYGRGVTRLKALPYLMETELLHMRVQSRIVKSLVIQRACQQHHMSRIVTKPIKWHVCPAKTQISLGIRPV